MAATPSTQVVVAQNHLEVGAKSLLEEELHTLVAAHTWEAVHKQAVVHMEHRTEEDTLEEVQDSHCFDS